MSYTPLKLSKLQILTHSLQFFDILLIQHIKMLKKILNTLMQPKISSYIDAKSWIQKILLEEKYGKINS
tara:strand:+ start:570 stop:776 length:207 start_codon:yes stop_codon:yes gene_type:complete